MNAIGTIVLAAGSSHRMGRNKLLLELGGETVVRRAAGTACAAALGPVVVVIGHARAAVAAELRGLECGTVVNHDHAAGQHTSVRAGSAALPASCGAAIVMLADMPFVTPSMLRFLARRHRETGAAMVVSRYGDEGTAPPILYDRRLFGELARVDRRCGRRLMRRHRKEAVEVVWPPSAMRDLDRPEDYERVCGDLASAALPDRVGRAVAAHSAVGLDPSRRLSQGTAQGSPGVTARDLSNGWSNGSAK